MHTELKPQGSSGIAPPPMRLGAGCGWVVCARMCVHVCVRMGGTCVCMHVCAHTHVCGAHACICAHVCARVCVWRGLALVGRGE